MKLLCIHPNFPGQFKHLLPRLLERGDYLWAIHKAGGSALQHPHLELRPYALQRGNGRDTFPLVLETESKVLRGQAAAAQAEQLLREGLVPDLILGHPGWGDMLFLADVWPQVPQLHYLEFFHGVPGTDNDIADRYATEQTLQERQRTRMKNANLLLNLNQMAWGLSPTQFQRSVLPAWAQARTSVIHDGINTGWLTPDPQAQLPLPNGTLLGAGDPVITFVNRTFEPYRGIHVFLEALALVQQRHASAHAVLVGADTPQVSYGAHRSDGRGWLTALREELGDQLDWTRIHTLGQVPHSTLRQIYQVSAAHVYLTYPFVLSWSLLEAMSCGCLVIGSATAPVQEVIRHGHNGLMVPFQDAGALAHSLLKALNQPQRMAPLRQQARLDSLAYALPRCLQQQLALIDSLASAR
jgi:glycosyltransferase involved in cell wall biosynthesis